MKDQHRATPEQWQAIKKNGHLPTRSTILELLHRIEALEAATTAQPNHPEIPDSSPLCVRCWAAAAAHTRAKPSHPAKPDSSLLSRVACADGPADAICEVAAWMRERRPWGAAFWAQLLEQEAEQ